MRILFVSALGESIALAHRCQREGAEVKFYVHSPDDRGVGRGIVQHVIDWRAHLRWADLVVIDDVWMKVKNNPIPYGGGQWAAEVRRRGKPCVGGGGRITDDLENDRKFGQAILQLFRIGTVVPMHEFRGWAAFDAAIRFVRQKGGAWALKHNAQVDKNLAAVQWTPEEMVSYLEWLKEAWPHYARGFEPNFVLQQAVKGIEISTTGVFDGRTWHGVIIAQEYKRFMPGDYGPLTDAMGEMTTVQDDNRLWHEGLRKLGEWLSKQDYRGCIDLAYIATEDHIVPLEMTARFGYGTMWNLLTLWDKSVLDLLWLMATGEGRPKWKPGFACYVAVASGSYPRPSEGRDERIRVLGPVLDDPNIWPISVQAIHPERTAWNARPPQISRPAAIEASGSSAYLACVTGYGDTIQAARRAAYQNVAKLKVLPYAIIRNDIGHNFERDWNQLRSWGWVH